MAVEDIMAQVAQAAQGHSDGSGLKAAENTVFRLFSLMLSEGGGAASLRRTARSNLLNLVLFLVDWVQLSAIMTSPATGYKFSWGVLKFLQQLSLLRLLGIDASTIHAFVGMWIASAVVVIVALANAGYVAYQVRVGFSGSLLPVRTLRAAVTVLLTAGYVPLIEILAEPLSCERLQQRSATPLVDIPCWGPLHATFFTLAAALLLGFVSFALLMRSVYFADAPLSRNIMGKPIARNEFWDTVARTLLVLLALFLPQSNPMLMTALFAAMFGLLTLQALMHLPYFKLGMTQLRMATYCGLVWMALGGLVAQLMEGSDHVELTAAVWLSATVPVLGLGAMAAYWRQRWMERKGVAIARFHMALQAENQASEAAQWGGASAPHARHQTPGSVSSSAIHGTDDAGRSLPGGDNAAPRFKLPTDAKAADSTQATLTLPVVERPAHSRPAAEPAVDQVSNLSVKTPLGLASAAPGVPAPKVELPPSFGYATRDPLAAPDEEDPELDELLGSGPDPSSLESHASHVLSSDTDVELFVRALLARPTQRRLSYARALLDEAMHVFPESVFVRLTFTTYLFSRSATYMDTMLALRLLAEASKISAPLDLRFAVFSKLNSAMNARRRLVLSDGQPGMRHDSLDLVEFKKGVKRAGDKHRESVSLLLSYWTTLAHGGSDGILIRGRPVTEVVSGIIEAADEAEKSYLSVLERWPSSQQLQRAYGIFLINVRNDKDIGEAYLSMGENADDDDAESRAGGSIGGGSRSRSRHFSHAAGSVGMRSAMSGASLTSVENIKRRKLRLRNNGSRLAGTLRDITRMRNGFRLGLLGLLAIIVVMFVIASTLFAEVRLTVATMNSAGLRRALAQAAVYNSRGQRLAAAEGDAISYFDFQRANLGAAAKLHTITENLYFFGPQPRSVNHQWVDPVVSVRLWNPDPSPGAMRTVKLGLLDASNLFVANTVSVGRQNLSTMAVPWEPLPGMPGASAVPTGHVDPYFSNTAYRFVLENANELVAHLDVAANLYQQANVDAATVTDAIIFALSGVRFAVLGILAWWVVRPAIVAIRAQRLILRSLVLAVPRKVASHMARRLKAVHHAMSEMTTQVATLEELDPTTKTYTTLRNSGFLTTLPRAKPKSSNRHHSRGRHRLAPLPPQALESAPAPGSALTAGATGASPAPSPVLAGVPISRDEEMYAIPEESDGDSSSNAAEGSHGSDSDDMRLGQSSASSRIAPSPSGFFTGALRQAGGALHSSAQSSPSRDRRAERALVDAKSTPATHTDDGAIEPPPMTPFKPEDDEGADGNLVHELDLLESVHDADELAQLLERRRRSSLVSKSRTDALPKAHAPPTLGRNGKLHPEFLSRPKPSRVVSRHPGRAETPFGGGSTGAQVLPQQAGESCDQDITGLVEPTSKAPAGTSAGGSTAFSGTGSAQPAQPRPPPSSSGASTAAAPTTGCCGGVRRRRMARLARSPGISRAYRTGAKRAPDDEAERKLGLCSNTSLRKIVVRATVVLTALVGLMAATTSVISTFAALTTSKPAELNAAGRRRMLAVSTVNDIRELILADGQVALPEMLPAQILAKLDHYEKVHDALRLGDPSMGLPIRDPSSGEPAALTTLYYGAEDKTFPQMPQDDLGFRDFEDVGLDLMLRHFWETSRRVVSAYANASVPRPNRTLSGLLSVHQFRVAWEMERGSLQVKLGEAVQIYTAVDAEIVNTLEAEAYVILSVEVVVLAIAYLLVYEGISTALVSEHMRAKDLRELVPPFILEGTPELLRAFGGMVSKD